MPGAPYEVSEPRDSMGGVKWDVEFVHEGETAWMRESCGEGLLAEGRLDV